jgi:hypothetical protein
MQLWIWILSLSKMYLTFIYFVVWINNLFLFTAELYSIVKMDSSFIAGDQTAFLSKMINQISICS